MERCSKCETWLLEKSRTRRFSFCSRPDRSVMALWERYSSSRFLREERPVICVRRLDWMEMILRLERESRF